MENDFYYLIKRFDDDTLDYIRRRFDRESGLIFMERFNKLNDEILELWKARISPKSEKCQKAVRAYWELVMEFINGDMNMLPKLMEFGRLEQGTDPWEEKQKKIINTYLEPAF